MEVYFVRHGDAGARDQKKFPDDRLRPLTVDGTERMREIARAMRKIGIEFEAIFDSGYVRARQSAEAITDAYRIDASDIKTSAALEPERDPNEVVALLKKTGAAKSVVLVGHDPHLSRAVTMLTGGRDGIRVDFKKGSVCRVDLERVEPGIGVLMYMLPPKVLRKIK